MSLYTRFAALVFTAALALGLGACGKQGGSDALVIYAAGPRELAEWMCSTYEQQTGHKTKLFSATTGEIMAKLQAEAAHPQADVVILASPTAAEVLKDQRMLAPLPQGLPTRPEWLDKDGYYAGTAASALGIALRRDRYNPNLEWQDFFDGRFQGAVIMPSPTQSGTSSEFLIAFDLAKGAEFWNGLRQLKTHGLQVSGPNSQALASLVLGAHDAVIAAADYLVFKQIGKGEPLVMHFPASGCPVIPRPVAILKDSQNREAANGFVRFCFDPAVQSQIAKLHLLPADPKIPLSPVRASADKLNPLPFDVSAAVGRQREVLERFQTEIEKASQ